MNEQRKQKYLSSISEYKKIVNDCNLLGTRSVPVSTCDQLLAMGLNLISNFRYSVYFDQANSILSLSYSDKYKSEKLYGVLLALESAIKEDFLDEFQELVHAKTFDSFIEMAGHLLSEGYKDASAVMIGSTLELHLKNLAVKSGVALEFEDSKGKPKSKKINLIIDELTKEKVLSSYDKKQVISWMDLRNSAAHGHYDKYTINQVELMLEGVKDLMKRLAA